MRSLAVSVSHILAMTWGRSHLCLRQCYETNSALRLKRFAVHFWDIYSVFSEFVFCKNSKFSILRHHTAARLWKMICWSLLYQTGQTLTSNPELNVGQNHSTSDLHKKKGYGDWFRGREGCCLILSGITGCMMGNPPGQISGHRWSIAFF